MSNVQNIRNRKPITDARALKLIAECIEGVKALGYNVPEIRFLQCKATRRAGLACHGDKTIVLSSWLFNESDKSAKRTIFHEIAHIVAGPGVKHGPGWQSIVRKINKTYDQNISRLYSDADMPVHAAARKQLNYKYIFVCEGCGCELHYRKATKFTRTYDEKLYNGSPRWTCTKCGHAFKLVKGE